MSGNQILSLAHPNQVSSYSNVHPLIHFLPSFHLFCDNFINVCSAVRLFSPSTFSLLSQPLLSLSFPNRLFYSTVSLIKAICGIKTLDWNLVRSLVGTQLKTTTSFLNLAIKHSPTGIKEPCLTSPPIPNC